MSSIPIVLKTMAELQWTEIETGGCVSSVFLQHHDVGEGSNHIQLIIFAA